MIKLRIQNSIDKIKETFKRETEKLKKDSDDTSNKLTIIQSWRIIQDEIIFILMALKNGKKNLGWTQSKI